MIPPALLVTAIIKAMWDFISKNQIVLNIFQYNRYPPKRVLNTVIFESHVR